MPLRIGFELIHGWGSPAVTSTVPAKRNAMHGNAKVFQVTLAAVNEQTHSSMSERLLAACWALMAASPLLMVFSRGIAPLVLALVSLVLLVLTLQRFGGATMRAHLQDIAKQPAVWLIVLAAIYLALSVSWSPAPGRGFTFATHVIASTLIAFGGLASLTLLKPRVATPTSVLALFVGLAALLVIVELLFDAPLRSLLPGATIEPYRLNRTAVALALFLPLVCGLLLAEQRIKLAVMVTVLVFAATFVSVSQSAQLAVLLAITVYGLALWLPRAVPWGVLMAILASLFLTPLVVVHLNSLIPQAIHDAIGFGTLGVRGEIWTAYAQLISQAFWLGHGLEASSLTAQTLAEAVPEQTLNYLNYGHPHNLVIQIWFELGLVGVVLTAGLLVCAWHAVLRLSSPLVPAGLASMSAVWTVGLVSHGAWQAWWWSLVAVLAMLFVAACQNRPSQ